ncbi:GM14119 [Drosophila sechellia]|uniref:GM14119 n=1 Tax=Drosophila sechellia TaxID=7238 RepID=B4HTD3_DROSE|nr:GM14119 [Drosophila sechellia]
MGPEMSSVKVLASLAVIGLLVLSPAEGISRPLPPYVGLPTQDGLTRLFLNSRVTQTDSLCLGGMFRANYTKCYNAAADSRKGIDADFLATRRTIRLSSERVCSELRACNNINTTLASFQCHANVGSNNTVSTYSISGNASESASVLEERYRVVDLRHSQCCQRAERHYVESTARNYNYLQACLDGRAKPKPMPKPTSTTSTTTTTTTTTTTEAPTEPPTTTEAPLNVEDQFKQLLNLLN